MQLEAAWHYLNSASACTVGKTLFSELKAGDGIVEKVVPCIVIA